MIELTDISRTFQRFTALEHVDLKLEEGGFLGLLGADDAGKTTLLHIIMGFDKGYEGTVHTLGKLPREWTETDRGAVRFVPDDIIWERNMTAEEYLRIAEAACPRLEDYDAELEQQLCGEYEIDMKTKLLDMTYNQNKLVQIIAAVCARPKLLILDEPVNFLSTASYRSLLEHLKAWNEKGMSILVAAEKYEDVRGYIKEYVYLDEGEVLAAAAVPTPDFHSKVVTLEQPANPAVEGLMTQERGFRFLNERLGRRRYAFSGNSKLLLRLLDKLACQDVVIDEMTLEEELKQDYSRWE